MTLVFLKYIAQVSKGIDYSSICTLPRKHQVLSKVYLKLLLCPLVRKPELSWIPSMTICSFIHLNIHSFRKPLSKHWHAVVSPGTLYDNQNTVSALQVCGRSQTWKNNNTLWKVPSWRYAVGAQGHSLIGKLRLYRGDNKLSCLKESLLAFYSLAKYIYLFVYSAFPELYQRW